MLTLLELMACIISLLQSTVEVDLELTIIITIQWWRLIWNLPLISMWTCLGNFSNLPPTHANLDLHELQQNGFFYTNVVGSTCTAVAQICYAKVVELSNDAYVDLKYFPDVLRDSSHQHG
jgi:hypothetical protein